MTTAAQKLTATVSRDGAEIARSFAAGGLYMAVIASAGLGTLAFVQTYAPVVAEEIAPHRFPIYAADKLERVERFAENRWDARPERKDTISKVAIMDDADLGVQ